jgi:hypothetical protein
MSYSLNQKKVIERHVKRNFKRWFKTYPFVEGVHVGQKKKNGTLTEIYSIVFHVSTKKLRPRKAIPPSLPVRINGKRVKVATDVLEVGKLKFEGVKIGEQTQADSSTVVGTISFYVDGSTDTYLGSNMHVLAPSYLKRGILSYDSRNGDKPIDISFFNDEIESTATLITATFGGIDFGFARIHEPIVPEVIERVVPGVGRLKGTLRLTKSNYKNVIDPSLFGATSKLIACTIRDVGIRKKTKYPNVFLTNLIMLERCTQDGDSGAPLFDADDRLMGFVVGRDEEASYALHIGDILEFFQDSNL